MNKQRRKILGELASQLAAIREAIEAVRDEEQEAFDNLPEGLQQGERGEAMESAIDTLENVATDLESAESSLGELAEQQ